MTETERIASIQRYLDEVSAQFNSGHAREHAYRPALERLMGSFDDVLAVNDPKRSENGNPDFVFLKNSNKDIILGYAEAKDITVDLDKTLKTEQLRRYAGYDKLFLTNYRDFIFLTNGEEFFRISLSKLNNGVLITDDTQTLRLVNELEAFLAKKPEAIKSGKSLAVIMGGKARRIRDNVNEYLGREDGERNNELEKIYGLMKSLLVHDLTKEQFADLYAQTLVYGLFAARYNDETPDDFDRREAVENVPKTNPFLRQFFNHIAGADFDARLRYIVDELCEVFALSDIKKLVEYQAKKFAVDNEKDLTIHFYEDFLKEYDPIMRQKMGVYYTPVPVVRYIVRSVDRILKEEFGIVKGLASSETIDHWVETGQDHRPDRRYKSQTGYYRKLPRVQVLDPAVGTATFLNETIKHVHNSFVGQEGRWPAYVKDNLIQRLHGFELMMAPYTIAHLKLSMTLAETGVKDAGDRLGIYLTNTLEEGVPVQNDLFAMFGLAEAVSEESRHAAEIKSNQPIMVVIGNPPYSISSNNKSKWIQGLIKDYKKDLNERKINLDDDYIKFIRFAENMIDKNSSGVVAMITNNSYIDGVTHRQMRKHLLMTFDKVFVLDLHGSTTKEETSPDGSKDENVFAIKQGVSIILMVKHGNKNANGLGKAYHSELFGTRKHKFNELNNDAPVFASIEAAAPNYFFVPKDLRDHDTYHGYIALEELFLINNTGIQTKKDSLALAFETSELESKLDYIRNHEPDEIRSHFSLGSDGRDWAVAWAKSDVQNSEYAVERVLYRPFDIRYMFYSGKTRGLIAYPRHSTSRHMLKNNIALVTLRLNQENDKFVALVADTLVEKGSLATGNYSFFPLYLYHDDGTRTSNLSTEVLRKLTTYLENKPTPEDVLDYIYAVMNSSVYRKKYKDFLKTNFPRIPIPNQAEFDRLVPLGRELRTLHLMKLSDDYDTTFPEAGSNKVERVAYEGGKVWINEYQYFGNVTDEAWQQYVGGYQPAQKWLKDRKGRELSDKDTDQYQKIIKILIETDRIMRAIDATEKSFI